MYSLGIRLDNTVFHSEMPDMNRQGVDPRKMSPQAYAGPSVYPTGPTD